MLSKFFNFGKSAESESKGKKESENKGEKDGSNNASNVSNVLREIPGLVIIENFITHAEELKLLEKVNAAPWNGNLKRRTQHYGFKYNYTDRNLDKDNYLGPLPEFSEFVLQRMLDNQLISERPVQLIVNEYTPGQGIAAHTDAKVFGDPVISLSLGSHCMFVFTQGTKKIELYLKPRTLIIMRGESRWNWQHAIPLKKSDVNPVTGKTEQRGIRISLTFRTVPGVSLPSE